MRSKHLSTVMPAQRHPAALRGGDPVFAGIHVFPLPTLPRLRGRVGRGSKQGVDGWDKPGHDSHRFAVAITAAQKGKAT